MILKEKPLIGVEFWVISSLKLVEIVECVTRNTSACSGRPGGFESPHTWDTKKG
ncbi:hypothetical protein CsatA_023105 [Cannabis sativa]